MIYFFNVDGKCLGSTELEHVDPLVKAELLRLHTLSYAAATVLEVPDRFDISTIYSDSGVIHSFTTAEQDAKNNPPLGFVWKMPERILVDMRALADAKKNKLLELLKACDNAINPIKAGYPEGEQQTWDKQENEARAFIANASAPTPLLSALSSARGITVSNLAGRIVAKSDAFASACGNYIGKRQKHEDDVTSATTIAQVDAIVW
jgi:hypothetical protein